EISYTQLLNPLGEPTGILPDFVQNKATLIHLYRNMLLTRAFDKRAIALQRTGRIGTYAPVHGQEAIGTAIGHALRAEDVFIPYYRDYAAQFQRGVTMEEILRYWGGDERGNNYSHSPHDLPISVPIASQCQHAAGIAFAFKYRKEPRVALVSLGDGATSEGDFYEAMNVAGCWKLPVVFVINNNQWAISVPLTQQTATPTLAQKAIAAGIPGIQVDGNDVLALRACIGDAIEAARNGKGPTLIEALTYRLSDHTTADDATRYQPPLDVTTASRNEPIIRFKHFLEAHIGWSQSDDMGLLEGILNDLHQAVNHYQNTPTQPVSSAFDFHFATLPDYLIEQRAIAMEEAEDA
ncbi:MAG: pyruvate dehydrogenase (acetyl-transferring) E1 component subunit alpha, partial [Legionella sp. 21-45-4]